MIKVGEPKVEEAMNKPKRVSSPIYTFFPTEVEGFDSLAELAELCRAQGLWLHVDAAYGWPALLT